MLFWRISLGAVIIAILAGLCWLDHSASMPGTWLLPLAAAFVIPATGEMSDLTASISAKPSLWLVYSGNLLIVFVAWIPIVLEKFGIRVMPDAASSLHQAFFLAGWPFAAFSICIAAVFFDEMQRFEKPGRAIANMSATVLGLAYVGVLFSFLVQLRLAWGVGAMVSQIVVVKMGDTGAYTFGRLFGRHKLTPILSPGKTVEGGIGAIIFSCLGAWACWHFLSLSGWAWMPFGVLIGATGVIGDLAESLLKRDAGRKNSSVWMPGFGGILDIIDSILFTAPIAWIFWAVVLAT